MNNSGSANPPSEDQKHIGKVLVVDDEGFNRELLLDLLEPMGYQVSTAPNGATALEMVASDPPDVILLDVMMPGLDGFEVAQRIRQEEASKGIPVVMVTALRATEDRVRALEAGANDFFVQTGGQGRAAGHGPAPRCR